MERKPDETPTDSAELHRELGYKHLPGSLKSLQALGAALHQASDVLGTRGFKS